MSEGPGEASDAVSEGDGRVTGEPPLGAAFLPPFPPPAPGQPGQPRSGDPSAPPPVPETQWQRLDWRMLLVHPVREVIRFLPVIIGVLVASRAAPGGTRLQLFSVVVPIALGLVRYFTTSYRIHAGRIELRRGLLNRSTLSTPLDRVRTVDLTASVIHRLLGLSTVRIGTGTAARLGDDGLDLDGLPRERAHRLRAELLDSIAEPSPEQAGVHGVRRVARFDAGWLRYAPFTSTGLVVLAGLVGGGFQLADALGGLDQLQEDPPLLSFQLGSAVGVVLLALVVAVLVAAFSVLGYLVSNGNFTLSHTLPDGSWHVRRGLLTTRETSLDDDRLRGVALGEPLGLRLVRGGRLSAIVTGLDRTQTGSSTLLPPTPRSLVDRVAGDVVGSPEPVTAALTDHGPRARLRRYTRAGVPALAVAGLLLAAAAFDGGPWALVTAVVVLAVALGLGHDRARTLGHALVDGWLVARSGSLTCRRELLANDAIIGWNLRSTWFQRRAGLVTLVATTAGGRQAVAVPDVPEAVGVAVAVAGVPGLLEPFLEQPAAIPDRVVPPVR